MSPPRVLAVIAAAAVLAAGVLLVVWQRTTSGVLAGVHVAEVDVSGRARDALPAAVEQAARASLDEPVVVRGDRTTTAAVRAAVGVAADVDATVEAAWRRGRQRNPFAALVDHVGARLGRTIVVEVTEAIDEAVAQRWAEDIAAAMSRSPRDAGIRFARGPQPPVPGDEASRVLAVPPADGETVDGDTLAARLIDGLQEGGSVTIPAPSQDQRPAITQADLDAALPQAQRAVSTPLHLANPSDAASLDLTPEDLATILVGRSDPDAPEGERLGVGVAAERLQRRLDGDRRAAIEGDPSDARFVVRRGQVRIRGGRSGYRFNPDAVATRIEQLLAGGRSRGRLPGDATTPDFARSEAKELRIVEKVSAFTTEHACCESRVTNIQRMADLVDGVIIHPGERFSLNEHVGPRTADKGFVEGGVIVEGEFEEAVGGGVSQFATTFFNAALFAGIRIHQFQPHSYYISRYPAGHESTLNYGSIDVVVENDSPHGILVKTSYTDTSITVRLFSSEWAEVDVDVGPRHNVRDGDIRDGFDVSWTRTITYPDGTQEVEEYFHRYQPENESDGEA